MSAETSLWLNTMTLIGFTEKRGTAWHYREEVQGEQSNHYPGAIPVADVTRRLFDFKILPADVFLDGGVLIPDRQAMVHSKTGDVFGIFSDNYRGHDYEEWLVNNVSTILGDTLSIGSAGLLRKGAQAWVSVEVPENILTPEGVEFRPNLLACTSFDGTLATTYKRVVTNVVCDNTMAAGLSETGQVFKARHSRHSGNRIPEARDALALVHQTAENFEAEVKALCALTVTDDQWNAFLDAHIPAGESARAKTMAGNRRDAFKLLWTKDARVSPWSGTAFGVVQAVNTFEQHVARVNDSKHGGNRPERNMSKALTGKIDTLDAQTMATLMGVLV